jgi:5'-nucleotidase
MLKMKTLVFLLLIVFSLSAAQTKIVIVYTNNTNGILENCKCPAHAYGALEKRATLIKKIRNESENLIVVDAGDIFDIKQDTLLHRYIAHAYKYIDYDVWACGDQDFIEGFGFFRSALLKLPMQLVSSNIIIPDEKNREKYIIVKMGNVRIGITGSFNTALTKYIPEKAQDNIRVLNQDDALQKVLLELQKKSDYQIVISHSGFEKDTYLAEKFQEIDLIIGGHSQTVLNEPEKIGNTLIAQAGESGYRVGIMELKFNEKKFISADNRLLLLDKSVSDDPGILGIISEYHQKREQLRKERIKNE